MKYWFGYPVLECECGFETPDEDEFRRHLLKTGHKRKAEPVKKTRNKTGKQPVQPKEENNGL